MRASFSADASSQCLYDAVEVFLCFSRMTVSNSNHIMSTTRDTASMRHRSEHFQQNKIREKLHLVRPVSELPTVEYKSPEAEVIDKWFQDLNHYERTLDSMSRTSLDDSFKEELRAMESWFQVLTDTEKTTALYSLIQNCNQVLSIKINRLNKVQVRFFLTVLQQMLKMELPEVGSQRCNYK